MPPVGHGGKPISASDFKPMFALDPARHAQLDLIALGHAMILPKDSAKDGVDDEENPYTPAGYTYLGQFVDHDLTFDTQSDLADLNSFQLASNERTPRFDLDNVYGAGPSDQPYMYEHDATRSATGRMLLGSLLDNGVPDVVRNREGRAIIGDPRNDENAIITQLQSAFIRFHNALVDRAIAGNGVPKRTGADAFAWAQTETRRHYQRILLDDFLPRVIDPQARTVRTLFAALAQGVRPKPKYFCVEGGVPFMPLEFACAAYRLGHSMIRPGYRLNAATLLSIFAGQDDGLRGFQRLDTARGIDWSLFFHPTLAAGTQLDAAGRAANDALNADGAFKRTQFAYKLDPMLVDPLAHLPDDVAGGILPDDPNPVVLRSLAVRNLLRGRDFGLPSGEDVATLVGATVLGPDQLLVRDDTFAPASRVRVADKVPGLAGSTPLWFYILAEAEQSVIAAMAADPATGPQTLGTRLGEVGGLIVAETFVGLMLADRDSVLNTRSQWRSINHKPTFSMVEMLQVIGAL